MSTPNAADFAPTPAPTRASTPSSGQPLIQPQQQGGCDGEPTQAPQNPLGCGVPADEARALLRRPNTNATPLPRVRLYGGNLTITESAAELFRAIAPSHRLFYREDTVVEIAQQDGVPIITEVKPAQAVSLFEKHVAFTERKRAGDDWYFLPTTLNDKHARHYLASAECRELLPRLKGVTCCPILTERDGQLHQVNSGYDPHTGLFVTSIGEVPVVSVDVAVERLTGLFSEYSFKTPSDQSRAMASVITPALRFGGFLTESIPIEVAEADISQAGKSFRQTLVAAVYGETMAVVTQQTGGVTSMEELFQTCLLQGRLFVQIDNVRGKMDTQFLEAYLTASAKMPVRVAFQIAKQVDPRKHAVFISSNGFAATKDLANRISVVRILKRPNHLYNRPGGLNLRDHVLRNHRDYLAAVFAVIRHWHQAGKPSTEETRHDFRQWCQVCDWIIRNVFQLPPLMDGHSEAQDRAANPYLGFFRVLSLRLAARHRLNQPMTATNISEFCEEEEVDLPGLNAANQGEPNQRKIQVGRIMKGLLDAADERISEGYRVRRGEQRQLTDNNNSQILTTYSFSEVAV